MGSKSFYIKIVLFITDFILIDLSGKLAYYLTVNQAFNYEDPYLSFFLIFNLSWMCSGLFCGIYDRNRVLDFKRFFPNFLMATFLHVVFMGVYILGLNIDYIPKMYMFYAYLLGFLLHYSISVFSYPCVQLL